ncbi:hypothetical protein EU803_11295 [Loktanella sp. IMCC34160]|uniref:hypothetical protein n=1 Tax=Loktanella sp. IMCC34160 TaxID=2510646 RepID=UPI00101D8A64|nr:hypothetical protein [Loktanella sp. IMCC34160]RYG90584.1 hypothetical protein EU803_11295 [Loktanella sp. IMCC34160]
MFPDEWEGIEASYYDKSVTESADLIAEKDRLERTLRRLSDQGLNLVTMGTSEMSEDAKQVHQETLENVQDAIRKARAERDRFGETFDCRLIDAKRYERRVAVEEKLTTGLLNGELKLVSLNSSSAMIDDKSLCLNPDFELSFAFSWVKFPDRDGGLRCAVGFDRDEFDIWAAPFELPLIPKREDSIQQRTVDWLRCYQLELAKTTKVSTRGDVKEAHSVAFSGEGRSHFDCAWTLFTLEKAKAPGRKKSADTKTS